MIGISPSRIFFKVTSHHKFIHCHSWILVKIFDIQLRPSYWFLLSFLRQMCIKLSCFSRYWNENDNNITVKKALRDVVSDNHLRTWTYKHSLRIIFKLIIAYKCSKHQSTVLVRTGLEAAQTSHLKIITPVISIPNPPNSRYPRKLPHPGSNASSQTGSPTAQTIPSH